MEGFIMNEVPEDILNMAKNLISEGQKEALKKQLIIKQHTVTHQLEGFVKTKRGGRVVVRTSGTNRELVKQEFDKMVEEVKK